MKFAIPFYTRDNFVLIARLLPDSDWPETYEDWLAKTEIGERGVKKSGNTPVRVEVIPSAFEAWCHDHNQPVVRTTILSYCGWVLAREEIDSSRN